MLLLLLLQATKTTVTTKSLDGIYFTLGGTIVAAVIALIASLVASSRAATTGKEVALLAANAAADLKDKDYKRDYYKRVIDKRIKAIEEIEFMLGRFTSFERLIILENEATTEKLVHSYFRENNDALLNGIIKVFENDRTVFGTWCKNDTTKAVVEFIDFIIATARTVNKYEIKDTRDLMPDRLIIFSQFFEEINERIDEIEYFLGQEMATLYDIEGFFREKYKTG